MDFAYRGRHPLARLAAMATLNQFSGEQNWYTNTGATDHITSDIRNLSLRSNYHGSDFITIMDLTIMAQVCIFLIFGQTLLQLHQLPSS